MNSTFFSFVLRFEEQPRNNKRIQHTEPLFYPVMATKNEENVFASPLNGSDMVLVVEDRELHVHKWILTTQSPVFKAMFEGHFQEASQDKITLKEKEYKSMVQFLKLLYPSSMFGGTKSPLDDERRLSILALAEEYQCVNLIEQCIDEAKITPENVLQILPYAVNYHPTALPKMYDVINWSAPTSKLEEVLPKLESKVKEISRSHTMLLTKCRFLESGIVEMQDAMISVICDLLKQKKMLTQTRNNSGHAVCVSGSGFSFGTTAVDHGITNSVDSRCSHSINIQEISKTKSCVHCKENYKEKFIAPISSCKNTQTFYNMLQIGDDIATAVKEQN